MPFVPSFYTVRIAGVPLPVPYLEALREIEIETSIEAAAIFRLRFDLSRTALGDWDVLQVPLFRPLVPIQIRASLGFGLSETIVNGYVQDMQLNNESQPGKSSLEVVGMDATSTLMNLHEKSMPWPNLPDSEAVRAIFGQYGITPLVIPTPPTRTIRDTITMQRTTDIRFLRQCAKRHSFECYVQPDPIIGQDIGYFGPPRTFGLPQGVLSVDFGLETNLFNFHVSYDALQPTLAMTATVDPATKLPIPAITVGSLEFPLGLEPTLARILPPPVIRPTATHAANAAEAMHMVQSIVNRSSRAIQASGDVDGLKYSRVLRPGLPVSVRGAGREHSGAYYVTHVTHLISTDQYTQRFQAWRNAVGLTGAELFIDPFAAIS